MKKQRMRRAASLLLCLALLTAPVSAAERLCAGGRVHSGGAALAVPTAVISDAVICRKVDTIQNPSYRLTNQLEEWDDLKTTLKEQIVPQAVTELLQN